MKILRLNETFILAVVLPHKTADDAVARLTAAGIEFGVKPTRPSIPVKFFIQVRGVRQIARIIKMLTN